MQHQSKRLGHDQTTPWLQSVREGLKVCGECNGSGRLGRRRCPTCVGSGSYSYDGNGARVARYRGEWVRT